MTQSDEPHIQDGEHDHAQATQPSGRRRSLFTKLFWALVGTSLLNIFITMGLTILTQQLLLQRFVPETELLFVRNQLIGTLAFVGLLALVVGTVVAWLLSRHFTNPIRQLMEAMEHIFHNNSLQTKIISHRHDELGSLVNLFNGLLEKLGRTHDREVAIAKLKSQFIAVAAHQLRTPLTGLKWSLQWLADGEGGLLHEKQQQTVQRELEATDGMIEQVNELLSVAQFEEGHFGYQTKKIRIDRFIDGIIQGFALVAGSRKITLTCAKKIDDGLVVYGDPIQLKMALANLIDNAIRYTKPGGKVTVEASQTATSLLVRVTDTGIGIPRGEQGKLFTKFFRGSNAQALQPNGSGLGLFLTQNIIKGHGGTITLTSGEDQGTTFTTTIPLTAEESSVDSLHDSITTI